MLIVEIALLIIGFVFLIKGADILVGSAKTIAKQKHVSELVIGMTIVAIGTSLPELIVSIISALNGTVDIAVGNILGSNIFNTLLIIGATAVICAKCKKKLRVADQTVSVDIPYNLLATVALWFLLLDIPFDNAVQSTLARTDACVLLLFYIIFLYYTWRRTRENPRCESTTEGLKCGEQQSGNYKILSSCKTSPDKGWKWKNFKINYDGQKMPMLVAMIVIGCVMLFAGGKWVVESASDIARYFGMSETLIGLTIVAFGTSLPELITSITAARRGDPDMAIGNVVGSNVVNLLLILPVTALIKPIPIVEDFTVELILTCLSAVFLFVFSIVEFQRHGKRRLGTQSPVKEHEIDKVEGLILMLTYFAYLTYLIVKS